MIAVMNRQINLEVTFRMKRIIAIVTIVLTALTVGTSVASAQNYDDFNYKLAITHTTEYIQKGDDAYRMGKYEEAMEHYKRARSYNTFKGKPVVPEKDIEGKMDRCADAMRRARSEAARREQYDRAQSSNQSSNNRRKVTSYGLSYMTTAANEKCRILSVKCDNDYTAIDFEFNNDNRPTTVAIDRNTFVLDSKSGRKYSLIRCANITHTQSDTPVQAGVSHVFTLYFEPLRGGCDEIDIIEPGSSSWKFYFVPVKY